VTPARPSATLVLVRDAAGSGIEVLIVQRADRGDQNSHAWVFPGGLLDATDRELHPHFHDSDDAAASARLGVAEGGLDYWAAALRETVEEAGLLLAVSDDGRAVDAAEHAALLDDWRRASRELPRGEGGAAFAALCHAQRWRLPARALHPIAHWITPLGMPKRFDTRFLLAAAPQGQAVRIDGDEIVDHRWIAPAEMLRASSELRLRGPARSVAADLARHDSVNALLAWAAALGVTAPIQPRLALDARDRLQPVHPTHPAYAEIGRIDPHGRGLAFDSIRAATPVALVADRLWRVTANNGSVMTGPGTNTYLLRAAGDDWVLIDPGPDDAGHVQATLALLAKLQASLVAILVTHTHIDHSPAWGAIKAATGAPTHGRIADHPEWQDPSFVPDVALQGGERLDFGGGLVLHAVHTPGHASNHLCYRHEAERLLFTGDHVMQGSTVVINPPDGDMAAYLGSLAQLAADAPASFDVIAPGHGFLIEQPERLLRGLIAHRQRREAKVSAALTAFAEVSRAASLDELVTRVYDDVGVERHGVARRSLLAHLLHLRAQGRAEDSGGLWSARARSS
jgi:glyoxylase-like metal-dependent hydrolase (beta-lactamase superfamily II)/8-oxo-dGTP pyrophosphatase MutT (NUDIX family)